MSRNDAEDFAQRLYARIPGDYRARDAERNLPLLALMRVIGAQVANMRQDLDSLWDNFFIETCDDWVVPYIGALLGTHLVPHPVDSRSDRLDVWNTIIWRRSKGTPLMLAELAQDITGWPTDLAEFFQQLGWSQNMNHLRLSAPLTPSLRDPYPLSLLGHANDPCAHAADFDPSNPLDRARTCPVSLGVSRAAWGTPGRYQIKDLGFFVRRLQTFPVHGATPAAVDPGVVQPPDANCFTFDPLHRDIPLFVQDTQQPITRAAFEHAPWETFGTDIAVRQFGVLLADEAQPVATPFNGYNPCTFGQPGSGLALDSNSGMRLINTEHFLAGDRAFVITALWQQDDGSVISLGSLNTYYAAQGISGAFQAIDSATGTGILVLSLQPAPPPPPMLSPPTQQPAVVPFAGRFPGAILAIRNARTSGPLHMADGLYVYLPVASLSASESLTLFVADDGSTYFARLDPSLPPQLARASQGQLYPPRISSVSNNPAADFIALNRGPNGPGGLRIPDTTRFAGSGALFQAEIFTGAFQLLGGIATVAITDSSGTLPAFTYKPNPNAPDVTGLLDICVTPIAAAPPPAQPAVRSAARRRRTAAPTIAPALAPSDAPFIPATELIVINRSGQGLLVYLPEIPNAPATGVRFFVADDGSTYYVPADTSTIPADSLAGMVLARQASGQVLPIPGIWPLQQRRPVAINLCSCDRSGRLAADELGVDPELGRFAFAPQDPAISQGWLSVDYVEAFTYPVGALNFDRQLDPAQLATILVSQSGDAAPSVSAKPNAPVYPSVAQAIAAATDNDVIEIVDSATYAETSPTFLRNNLAGGTLTIRAAVEQRPCLTYYLPAASPPAAGSPPASNGPTQASLLITAPMSSLELNGLLISGGPLLLQNPVGDLHLVACSLDPRVAASGSIICTATEQEGDSNYLLCRCVTGGFRLDSSVSQLTVADSIVDQQGGFAIAAPALASSPPWGASDGPANASVQLERVTVFGRISCDVLSASECLLNDVAIVQDQQSGCVRFTRYEMGSVLPRHYRCVPSEEQPVACPSSGRCLVPLFNSLRFGRPDYAQLSFVGFSLGAKDVASLTPADKVRYGQWEILTASESQAEVGAFAGTLEVIRLGNLGLKLREFMPVGLSAVVIAET